MKRLRIGFDLDGVLADFAKYYVGRAKELWPGFEPKPEWDFGLSKAQQDVLWTEIKTRRNFWEQLQPISHTTETNWFQLAQRHTLFFITSRVPTAGHSVEFQTAEWLYDVLDVEWPTVLVVNHWHEKWELYKALRLDAFIDDKPETVTAMLRHKQYCVVFDQPWNRNVQELNNEMPDRVLSIEDYITLVETRLG